MNIKHAERLALKKLGMANEPNFKFYRWECLEGTDAVSLHGCICSGELVARGWRKGRTKFDGPELRAIVTEPEEAAEFARYESETGQCGECLGEGKELSRIDVTGATEYRACCACKGSGRAGAVGVSA